MVLSPDSQLCVEPTAAKNLNTGSNLQIFSIQKSKSQLILEVSWQNQVRILVIQTLLTCITKLCTHMDLMGRGWWYATLIIYLDF